MGLLDEAIREHLELKRRRGADAGEISREESEALGPVRRAPDGTPDLSSIPAPPPSPQDSVDVVYGDAPAAYDAEPDWSDEGTAHVPPAPPTDPAAAASAYAPHAAPPYESPAAPLPAGFDEPAADLFDEPPPADLFDEPAPQAPREKRRLGGGLRLRRRSQETEPPPAAEPPPERGDVDPPTAAHRPAPGPAPPPAAYLPPTPAAYPPPPAPEPDIVPADDEPEGEDLLEETPEFLEETPDHDRLWFEQRPPRDFDFDK